jgi:hypothetical protein
MDWDDDYALALQLQEQFDRESEESLIATSSGNFDIVDNQEPSQTLSNGRKPSSLCDNTWELVDPNPDARGLFLEFNEKYFWGKLNAVEVRWSSRMTL